MRIQRYFWNVHRDRSRRSLVRMLTTLAALFVSVACQPEGDNRTHVSLDTELGALRTAFNADSGSVRVVILAAPT